MVLKVDKSKAVCSLCEQAFKPESTYNSLLYLVEEQWKRVDICEACHDRAEPGFLATWRVKMEKKKKMVLSESAIWQVLKNKEDKELGTRPLTFILCLMMMRKRKLRVIETKTVKGQEFQTFANISRGIHLKVRVPALGPKAFHHLQEEISSFFSGDS
jgi:hypothetical protein